MEWNSKRTIPLRNTPAVFSTYGSLNGCLQSNHLMVSMKWIFQVPVCHPLDSQKKIISLSPSSSPSSLGRRAAFHSPMFEACDVAAWRSAGEPRHICPFGLLGSSNGGACATDSHYRHSGARFRSQKETGQADKPQHRAEARSRKRVGQVQ